MSRRYSHNKLISWSLNRCDVCGQYIGKERRKYCPKHAEEINYYVNNKENYIERARKWRLDNLEQKRLQTRRYNYIRRNTGVDYPWK